MIPDTLTDRDQWVCWTTERRDGKPTKIPVDPHSGKFASSTDADTWATLEQAQAYHDDSPKSDGVGFVFEADGIVAGVDLDDCRDPDTGEIDEWARDVVNRLDSFTEVSPSGTGLHIYVLGFLPDGGNRSDVGDGEIEMYDQGRFFTVTGNHLDVTPATVNQRNDALSTVHSDYVADDSSESDTNAEPEPNDIEAGELVEKAKNADDSGKFERLWRGDTSGYPSHSEARMALLCKLAFWTGGDKQRMDSLYRDSGLYPHPDKPGKWDRVGDDEIQSAIGKTGEYYEPGRATDGGTTTADSNTVVAQPETTEDPDLDGQEYDLNAAELIALLGYDTDDTSLKDIPTHELANGIEEMLRSRSDVNLHLLDTVDNKDQPIYAMDDESKVWIQTGKRRLGQHCRKILGFQNRKKIQNELENAVRSNPSGYWLKERDKLGIEVGYLPVKNGVLNLETRELRGARPDDYLLGRLPVEYDPDAGIEGTRFEEFLLQSVKADDREKLQEYAGYTLLKNAQPYKKALFLIGPTDSGKGTFLKTLESILGEENYASETLYDLVNTRWGTHSIYGTMANVSNEVSPEGISNVGQFKMLTGGEDKVPAEDKGVSKYRFSVTQKFLFATNEFPEVENADEAFFNRLLFVEFPNSFSDDKDENLKDDLRNEQTAILNWMLDGLDRLREKGDFTNERRIDDKRNITKAFGSPIEQFTHNALEVTNISEHVVHKKELYAAFTRFCDWLNADTPTQTKFTRTLKEQSGISDGQSTRVGDGTTDVFKGVKLEKQFFKTIQADLPDHSYGEGDGGQTNLGGH